MNELGLKIVALRKKGLSLRKIVEKLGCSKSTVSKWAGYTKNPNLAEKIDENRIARKRIKQEFGASTQKLINGGGAYNKEYRERRKRKLVELKGGKCKNCGYSKCLGALTFHHRDPLEKRFGLTAKNIKIISWENLMIEIEKCDLLCHNCHAEVHY